MLQVKLVAVGGALILFTTCILIGVYLQKTSPPSPPPGPDPTIDRLLSVQEHATSTVVAVDSLLFKDATEVFYKMQGAASSSIAVYFTEPDPETFAPVSDILTAEGSTDIQKYVLAYYIDKQKVYLFQIHHGAQEHLYFDSINADPNSFEVEGALRSKDKLHSYETIWSTRDNKFVVHQL